MAWLLSAGSSRVFDIRYGRFKQKLARGEIQAR